MTDDVDPGPADPAFDLPSLARDASRAAEYCNRTGADPSRFEDWPGTVAVLARRCIRAEAELARVAPARNALRQCAAVLEALWRVRPFGACDELYIDAAEALSAARATLEPDDIAPSLPLTAKEE